MILAWNDRMLVDSFLRAIRRQREKVRHLIRSKKVSRRKSDLELHYDGICAERTVAEYLGIPYDPEILLGGDDYDLVLPDGRTVEVKFRDHPKGDFALMSDRLEDFKADIGVLVCAVYPEIGDNAILHCVGWITREEFAERCERVNYGYGDRLAVKQCDLHPMDTLRFAG